MNIAGVVVLYNTDNEIIENIKTYLPILDKLYVVDNSTIEIETDILQYFNNKKIKYLKMNGNEGIGKALRIGAENAIKDNYDWLLTMDQDSKFPTENFKFVKKYLNEVDKEKISIVAINHKVEEVDNSQKDLVIDKKWVITSGSFINIDAYKKTNGFMEELFIEVVDTELCYQLNQKGYQIKFFPNISLIHQVGDVHREFKIFGKKIMSLNTHSPVRYYYVYRNLKYLSDKHGDIFKETYKQYGWKMHLRILFLESNRKEIFKFIKKAKKDAKMGKLGKYNG